MCHHAHCGWRNHDLSRRDFLLAAAGTTVAGALWLRTASAAEAARVGRPEPPAEWPRVRVAYLRPKDKYWLGWPGTAWEANAYEGFLAKSRTLLEAFGRELQVRVDFEPEPLCTPAAVEELAGRLQSDKPDGVVVFPLHMDRWDGVRTLAAAGVPTIIFAGLGMCFTGHIQALSKQAGAYLVSSPDYELGPVRLGLKMVRAHHDIRRTRIAVLAGHETKDEVLEPLGLHLRRLPRQRFAEALAAVGETPEVIALADEYQQAAREVVEPSRADLLHAARGYFAARQILEEEGCHGITMDCLGAVFDRQIPGPPCLAWSRFLDAGVPAICEADINAVMSHTLCCKLLDRPGFMQDPVPETVHNTFIGAHCVCPTRLHGYAEPRVPFRLRSHSESNLGVSLQVLWPAGETVTLMQFAGPERMLLGRGRVLRNFDTPPAGGCRTSVELALEAPADTRDTKGFHQLFIAGDHVRTFQAYGQMYGITTESI